MVVRQLDWAYVWGWLKGLKQGWDWGWGRGICLGRGQWLKLGVRHVIGIV